MGQPAQQRSRDLAPGDKLGRYDLIRQISVGGMGELYLARTLGIEGFEKLVVLKRILPVHVSTPSLVEMFLGEARLSATLLHANIAQVYDIGVEGSDYFFTMEYVHGEDLGRIVATAADSGVPLSLDAALTLLAGACAGLHYAHEKAGPDRKPLGIVHRDVSPPNVLVSYDGGVKLVDFGIARAVTKPTTAAGGLKGKLGYMSPERCTNDPTIDRRSDVFSLGTLLFELTTGRLPFVADTEDALVAKIVGEDAPSARDIVPDFPETLAKIIARALARNRADRYPTALEMQTAIEDFAHESRLRISGLVLARLMSTLFPARLEEWDHARKQGAFFVEQHIVQTMIEGDDRSGPVDASGQARPPTVTEMNAIPDTRPTAPSGPAPAPPPVIARVATPSSGTPRPPAPTPVIARAPTPTATPIVARAPTPPPVVATRAPTPPPVVATRAPTPAPAREPTPLPAPPPVAPPAVEPVAVGRSKPISRASLRATPAQNGDAMRGLPVAAAGTLISSPAPDAAVQSVSAVGDVTAQVRWPTKQRKRGPWIAGALVLAAGAAAAWAFSFGPLSGNTTITAAAAPVPAPAPVPDPTPAPVAPPVSASPPVMTPPPVVTPPPVAPPEPTPVVAPDPKPVAPPPVAAKKITKRPKRAPPAPRHPKPSAVEPKPDKLPEAQPAPPPPPPADPKPETKDQPWNADSPFMPVRAH